MAGARAGGRLSASDAERYRRARDVFTAALPLDGEERAALVERECAGDDVLRDEVHSLLARADRPNRLLDDATHGMRARR